MGLRFGEPVLFVEEKTEVRVGLRETGPKAKAELVLHRRGRRVAAALQPATHEQMNLRATALAAVHGGRLENGQCLVRTTETDQCLAQPGAGAQEGGVQSQGVVVARHCLLREAVFLEEFAQETVALRTLGAERDGGFKLGAGCVVAALLQHGARQKEMGWHVFAGDLERVRRHAPAVAPGIDLKGARDGQHHQRGRGHAAQGDARAAPRPHEVQSAPRHRDRETDERQIGVAVGHALRAHLHEPNHRNEHAQEPEPSHQQKRSAAPEDEGACREDREDCGRRECPIQRDLPKHHRVEECEATRPECSLQAWDCRRSSSLRL